MEQRSAEMNARAFAAVTHSAREMSEFMSRKVQVRIKNNRLTEKLGWSVWPVDDALILGKTITVSVNWGHTNIKNTLVLRVWEGDDYRFGNILLNEEEFFDVITQKGDIKLLFKIWKQYSEASGVS